MQKKQVEAIQTLLKIGANPNCTLVNDLSALLWTIQGKNESIALELLKHSEIDFDYRGIENTTAIELAVEMELPNVLTQIIHLGGDVNRKRHGKTPLHTAIEFDYLSGMKILMNADGINPYLSTSSGESTLSFAKRFGNQEIISFLASQNVR